MWGRQVPVEGEADGARSEPLSRQTGISSVTKCFRNIHALLLVALLHPALSISLLLRNPIFKTVFTSTCSFNAPFHHFGTFWQLPMMSWASIYFLMSLASQMPHLLACSQNWHLLTCFFLFFLSLLWDPYGNSSWKASHIVSCPISAQNMLSCEVRLNIA